MHTEYHTPKKLFRAVFRCDRHRRDELFEQSSIQCISFFLLKIGKRMNLLIKMRITKET